MKKVLLFAAFAAFAMTSVNAQDEDSSGFAKSDILHDRYSRIQQCFCWRC